MKMGFGGTQPLKYSNWCNLTHSCHQLWCCFVVMGRAFNRRDQALARVLIVELEPGLSPCCKSQAEPWWPSKFYYIQKPKSYNFLGPCQKVRLETGSSLDPSQNVEPEPGGLGSDPSLLLCTFIRDFEKIVAILWLY